jgi:hypothetical protein
MPNKDLVESFSFIVVKEKEKRKVLEKKSYYNKKCQEDQLCHQHPGHVPQTLDLYHV